LAPNWTQTPDKLFKAKSTSMKRIKVGILRETKNPPDKRVVLAPNQAAEFVQRFPDIDLVIQSSKIRCYKDEEYSSLGLNVHEDISDCDFLMGVKEVNIENLIPGKSYLFFSHTAKLQLHNRPLLLTCLQRNITLVDHEYLTNTKGERLVAFGKFAGIVGAYNAFISLGRRTGQFQLKRAKDCKDIKEMYDIISNAKIPPVKIILTGGGRVAQGAEEVLRIMKIKEVSPQEFLNNNYHEAVFTQLNPENYVERIDGEAFDFHHFVKHPAEYRSTFKPYSHKADLWIACHFWDQRSPHFLRPEDMTDHEFKIQIIADVSCDIQGPIPSTIRSSTIAEPFYGYNPFSHSEDEPWKQSIISVMAVDNLPGEIPRDASEYFGKALIDHVFPAFFGDDPDHVLARATITKDGQLTSYFSYLEEYIK